MEKVATFSTNVHFHLLILIKMYNCAIINITQTRYLMSGQQDMQRLSINIPRKEHMRLKALSALRGISIKELVLSCLEENLYAKNKPNAETLDVFKKTDKGQGIVHCQDIDDFLDRLEANE
ncbi:hypothetical protein SCG7109_AD_00090 [Chlamydiales bacterium SCGC AG-110-M15]|nr:hypothetical protein SCG7109_AD_00090 [Chlamydiales bacterium SCGC AG-110-M15]